MIEARLVEVDSIGCQRAVGLRCARTEVGGHVKILAIEAADVPADLRLIEMVVTRAGGENQSLRNDVDVDRPERGPLGDRAHRVVVESHIIVPSIWIVRCLSGSRRDIVVAIYSRPR